jgi:succinate dehydrogenase / fumarate reductase cytochrome b subunit
MAISRRVGVIAALRYRGGGPMLAWIFHRISGLGMVLFISLHIIASHFSLDAGSDWAIALNTIYMSVYFQLFIYFCVLYHGLNGIRIIVLDTWPKMLEYQKEVTWLQWLIFIPTYGLTIFLMVRQLLSGE